MSRSELSAHQAFRLLDRDVFYMVERGHVDLFLVEAEGDLSDVPTRRPFLTRIPAGKAFLGATSIPTNIRSGGVSIAFLAVPALDTVLHQGKLEQLASRDDFDLDAVSLIDDWVMSAAAAVTRYERTPRGAFLLEADPDVRYEAGSVVSAHHLNVLWVSADRPMHFLGRPEFPVAPGVILPLSEHLWLTLPGEARVSAAFTTSAIIAGELPAALDWYNHWLLQYADRVWDKETKEKEANLVQRQDRKSRIGTGIVRELTDLLGSGAPPDREAASGDGSALPAAAALVAESVGVRLVHSPAPADGGDMLSAVDAIVAPSGIRTRRLELPIGWERRDGPSFLGVDDDGEPRPVAVVNRGRGAYELTDPVSGETAPLSRRRAESLRTQGVMFYPPLAPDVDSGLAAVLQALRGRRRDIVSVALMGSLGALIALLTPVLIGELLGEIIPRVDIPMWVAALVALALGAFATAAVSIVGAFSMLRVEARIDETLQASIWSRLLSLPLPFFQRYLVGDLADRANGVSLIRQMLTGATSSSLVSGVFSIFSFALLFYYSWELALWAGVAVLVLAAGSWFFITRQIRHQRAVFMAQGLLDGLVFQMIVGLAKLRQANAELNVLRWWAKQYAEQRREHLSARMWAAGQFTFNAFFTPLSQLALLALIWYMLIEGETEVQFALGDFLSFHAAFGQFVGGVTGLTATWATVAAVLPLFERVLPIIETKPESVPGATVLPEVTGKIECESVTFRYPSAASDTLRNVSFQIRPGEYVAFLGPSGAGKSTLYRLLLGFERPTAGSVLLDGHDLLSLDLSAMRSHLGVVLQNGQIVPDSIIKVISGEAPLTMEEVWEVARAVGLDKDIEDMPLGMHTVLSEGGSNLSGGQRQRLLLARALARKPRVLLLDEATSMLDNRTQDTIRSTLRGLIATRIVIAHRLSTVVDADRLYVMRDGRIVETGRYQTLIEQDGVLAEMARRQMV